MPGIKRTRKRRTGRLRPARVGGTRLSKRAGLNQRTGGFLGLENKFFDTGIATVTVVAPTAGAGGEVDPTTLDCLNCPAVGDTEQSRDGRQICMNEITVKGTLTTAQKINQTALDLVPEIFVALVLDTQTNAATLDSEKVFVNPSTTALTACLPFRNLQYIKRFKILAYKLVKMPVPANSYDGANLEIGGVARSFQLHHSWKNCLKVNYGGTTSVVGSIIDNSLHVIAFSSSSTPTPTISYNARLRYTG